MRHVFLLPEQDRLACTSALVDAAERGNVAEVRRLLKEGCPLRLATLWVAANKGDFPVVKCLIKEGGIDIDAVITRGYPETTLSWAARRSNYPLIQWLIEEGALIPTNIWESHAKRVQHADGLPAGVAPDAAKLSSLLKVMMLLPMSLETDYFLPAFITELSPQHAELCTCTRGRRLQWRLPAFLEQQQASVSTRCPLPTVLQALLTTYALPTTEDLWSDGLQ
jgi:hypothetical protein